jgi:hypothetical protein
MSKSGTRAVATATYAERALLHSEVDPDTNCWVWGGYMRSGCPYVGISRAGGRKPTGAATINIRAAILGERGERPADAFCAIATCGQRLCVNPDHLAWETNADYRLRMRDVQPAKLSLSDVAKAFEDKQAGEPVTRIAEALGMSRQGLYRQWRKWGFDITRDES